MYGGVILIGIRSNVSFAFKNKEPLFYRIVGDGMRAAALPIEIRREVHDLRRARVPRIDLSACHLQEFCFVVQIEACFKCRIVLSFGLTAGIGVSRITSLSVPIMPFADCPHES